MDLTSVNWGPHVNTCPSLFARVKQSLYARNANYWSDRKP